VHLHCSSPITGADRIARADGRVTGAGDEHLDDWLSAWGLRLNALSTRWFCPLRPQLEALATECQRRAVEARSMRELLDEITDDARERVRHAPIRAQAELDAVVARWHP
jgi:hypothetical protein